MISIGTLMAFAVVCAGVVILRHQSPERPTDIPLLMGLFFIVCSLSAVSIIYRWPIWSIVVYGIPPIVFLVTFCFFKTVDKPNGFKTPLVPVVPCVGIYINLFLIFSLSPAALLRVILWTIVGLIIYFTYSIRYSKQGIYQTIMDKTIETAEYGAL